MAAADCHGGLAELAQSWQGAGRELEQTAVSHDLHPFCERSTQPVEPMVGKFETLSKTV